MQKQPKLSLSFISTKREEAGFSEVYNKATVLGFFLTNSKGKQEKNKNEREQQSCFEFEMRSNVKILMHHIYADFKANSSINYSFNSKSPHELLLKNIFGKTLKYFILFLRKQNLNKKLASLSVF